MKLLYDYYQLTKMQLLGLRSAFIIISVVNVGFIAGFVYGFGFLFGNVPQATALYITVGSATNALIVGGLVMLPQFLAQAKEEGRLDYIRSLPVSREAYLLANVTVIAGIVLPGSLWRWSPAGRGTTSVSTSARWCWSSSRWRRCPVRG